ncbi:MAG: cysteine-rich CWC family protein [Chthoniobacteraceae bacterium]
MKGEPEEVDDAQRWCNRVGHCPICGRSNQCRMETGEAYKGPCWCEKPTLSGAAVRRLTADLPEPRCLCPDCLEAIATDSEITREELVERGREKIAFQPAALIDGDFYYEGPAMVFTAQYHLRRGSCCGSGCRHCPYRNPVGP